MPTTGRKPQPARSTALTLRLSWPSVCVTMMSALLLSAMAVAARAQANEANWWEGIPGFGSPSYSDKPKAGKTPAKADVLNDLRQDNIPWRSDEMLTQVEAAVGKYRQYVAKGGWPAIPGNRMLRPGDDDERVPVLRKRLRVTGELRQGGGFDDFNFDSVLEDAVRRFQDHHGLRTSGRVDQMTLAALNITAQERLDQLQVNRDRIAELVRTPVEERYVLVNSAAFQLEAVDRFQVEQRHRVIVGRTERETPVLRAMIKAVNFFPNWKVPDSVAQLDVFPRLVKEPQYLEKEKIRVLAGDFNGPEIDAAAIDWSQADAKLVKLRQDPGPQNALGLVRIDMQNEEGVYMHDTPLKPLFEQRARAFSAGCVRVQDVFKLVDWITRFEPGWEQPGQVDATLQSGQALDLALTRPVPVYFTYITAWAEANGRVEFRSDIYKRDGKQFGPDVIDPDAPPPPAQGLAP